MKNPPVINDDAAFTYAVILAALLLALLPLITVGFMQRDAMASCLEQHSFDLCHHTIYGG